MKFFEALIFTIAFSLLSYAKTADYLEIHKKAVVADLHCDTVMKMEGGWDFSKRDTSGHIDLVRLKEGGVDLQAFACFIDTDTPKDKCRPAVDEMIDTLLSNINRHPDSIAVCTTEAQAEKIIKAGKIAAFIGIENGVAIADSLENLRHFYERGVRYLTLTHVKSNDWCISSADMTPAFHGLTDFGREVVREMNRLGMIIDVSHASKDAIAEVLKITKDPVIASHSCIYALCPSDRNLTDDQIKAIAKNGGVIGINFFTAYLSGEIKRVSDSVFKAHQAERDFISALYKDNPDARWKALEPIFNAAHQATQKIKVDIGTLVDHIDHIVKLVGPEFVGLGSDYDGIPSAPKGADNCSMLPNITKELVRRGYSEKDISKILGGNFMRVFKKVCDR